MAKSERLTLIASAVNNVQNNKVLSSNEMKNIIDNEYCIKQQCKVEYKQLNFN